MPQRARKIRKVALTARDRELLDRVRALRESLRLNQQEFADRLGVNRTQVVAWENKRETPSVEKQILMAHEASRQDRLWFLTHAGLDMDQLKGDFREDLSLRTGRAHSGLVADIPILLEARTVEAGSAKESDLQISAKHIEHLASTHWAEFPGWPKLQWTTPWPLAAGDVVLIDTSVRTPSDLLSGRRSPFAAVYFERTPEHLIGVPAPKGKDATERIQRSQEWNRPGNSQQLASQKIANEEALRATDVEMATRQLLCGWILEQRAGGEIREMSTEANEPSRLILGFSQKGAPAVALTEWRSGRLDLARVRLLHGAQILGAVVGWISTPRGPKDYSVNEPIDG